MNNVLEAKMPFWDMMRSCLNDEPARLLHADNVVSWNVNKKENEHNAPTIRKRARLPVSFYSENDEGTLRASYETASASIFKTTAKQKIDDICGIRAFSCVDTETPR